jgi:hypothetical protein
VPIVACRGYIKVISYLLTKIIRKSQFCQNVWKYAG